VEERRSCRDRPQVLLPLPSFFIYSRIHDIDKNTTPALAARRRPSRVCGLVGVVVIIFVTLRFGFHHRIYPWYPNLHVVDAQGVEDPVFRQEPDHWLRVPASSCTSFSTMALDFRSLLRRPIHLILDWDGTITKNDTLSLVGEIGYHHRKHNPELDNVYGKPPPWSHLADAWMEDFSAHQAHYEPKTSARRTIREERTWLSSLTPIENNSVRRVEGSKLFKGVTADRDVNVVVSAAVGEGRLRLRHGWDSLLARLLKKRQDRASILSVNWSGTFIRQAMSHSALRNGECPDTKEDIRFIQDAIASMDIQANEIFGLDTPEGSDGSLTKNSEAGIRTSADKLAHMPESCRKRLDLVEAACEEPSDTVELSEQTVVYVGDSSTDFEALLAADVGICIRDTPMGSGQRELAETFERVGVEVLHVDEGFATRPDETKIVYWARDLKEIVDILSRAEH